MVMKLHYSRNLNPRVAVAVARHLKSPVEFVRTEAFGPNRADFLRINPNGLLPVLEEPQRTLWECDAIALRLARLAGTGFWPDEHADEMMMWVSWSAHHFTLAGGTFYFENIIAPQSMGRGPDADLLERAEDDFRRFAWVLDQLLAKRNWLVGGRLTYADFRVASSLPFADRSGLPLSEFRNIVAWHDRLNQFDGWREPFAGLD